MTGVQVKRNSQRDDKGRFTKKNKWKVVIWIWMLAGTSFLFLTAVTQFNEWSSKKEIVTRSPFAIQLHKPIQVVNREPLVVLSPVGEGAKQFEGVEELIANRWGVYEAKTAIAVAKAESGIKSDALNFNTNSTYDVGVFQINSIHWDSDYCPGLHDLTEVEKNIECAYKIWERNGWNAWSAFNNGAFRKFL